MRRTKSRWQSERQRRTVVGGSKGEEHPDGVSPLMAMEDVPAGGVREAGAGDGDDPALPALRHRRDQQRDRRSHHPAAERAARRTRLGAGSAGENPERISKLQYREPPRTLTDSKSADDSTSRPAHAPCSDPLKDTVGAYAVALRENPRIVPFGAWPRFGRKPPKITSPLHRYG